MAKEKERTYYGAYRLQQADEKLEDFKELSFVCLKQDGTFKIRKSLLHDFL